MSGAQIQLFASRATTGIRWRLLTGNNREVARSVAEFADEGAAHQAIAAMQAAAGSLTVRTHRHSSNRWTWEVRAGDEVVAGAVRPFDRQIRCEQAMNQALTHLPVARVRPGVIDGAGRRLREDAR